jgi:hypothetical protein
MPEISRFFGIVISMHFREHLPPHFHAEYGEDEATIDIRALTVLDGVLSSRSLGMVIEWASQHQSELLDLWERAQRRQSLYKLPPLK